MAGSACSTASPTQSTHDNSLSSARSSASSATREGIPPRNSPGAEAPPRRRPRPAPSPMRRPSLPPATSPRSSGASAPPSPRASCRPAIPSQHVTSLDDRVSHQVVSPMPSPIGGGGADRQTRGPLSASSSHSPRRHRDVHSSRPARHSDRPAAGLRSHRLPTSSTSTSPGSSAATSGRTYEAGTIDLDLQDELAAAANMPRIGSMFIRLTLQLRLFVTIFGLNYRYPTDEIVADDQRILVEIRRHDPDGAVSAGAAKSITARASCSPISRPIEWPDHIRTSGVLTACPPQQRCRGCSDSNAIAVDTVPARSQTTEHVRRRRRPARRTMPGLFDVRRRI